MPKSEPATTGDVQLAIVMVVVVLILFTSLQWALTKSRLAKIEQKVNQCQP